MRAALAETVKRVINTGTVATPGLHADRSPPNTRSPIRFQDMVGLFKRSRFLRERQLHRLIRCDELPAVIVNPSTPLGRRDVKPTPTGAIMVNAMNGRMSVYVDTGLNLVPVHDVAAGQWLALKRGRIGESDIPASENLTSRHILLAIPAMTGRRAPQFGILRALAMFLASVTERAIRAVGRETPTVPIDSVMLSKQKAFLTCDNARKELGFASHPPMQALREAIHWFRLHNTHRSEASIRNASP